MVSCMLYICHNRCVHLCHDLRFPAQVQLASLGQPRSNFEPTYHFGSYACEACLQSCGHASTLSNDGLTSVRYVFLRTAVYNQHVIVPVACQDVLLLQTTSFGMNRGSRQVIFLSVTRVPGPLHQICPEQFLVLGAHTLLTKMPWWPASRGIRSHNSLYVIPSSVCHDLAAIACNAQVMFAPRFLLGPHVYGSKDASRWRIAARF